MLWQPTRGILQPNQHWRRPQGGAAADTPATIYGANLLGWWKHDVGVTLSGSNATAVADQTGNGRNLSNIGTVPFASGFNVIAANNAALKTDFSLTGTVAAVFVVASMKTATVDSGGLCVYSKDTVNTNDYAQNGSAVFLLRDGSNNGISYYRNGITAASAISLDTLYRFATVFDGTNVNLYVNGSSVGSDACSLTFEAGDDSELAFGNRDVGGSEWQAAAWEGLIKEMFVVDVAPSGGQFTATEAYLVSRGY